MRKNILKFEFYIIYILKEYNFHPLNKKALQLQAYF